ncbi:MAG: FimV/HubP family polar landmark protein [Gammaproteobacteria bacterium]
MFRKLAIAAALLCLSVTSRVFAIGLGDIKIQSMLNAPLDAVIQLTSASKQELDELKITIAPRESFQKMGIPRTAILDDIKFRVEQTPGGLPVIRVTTRQPVREPFLDFLIEASWSKGHLLRQYTLLVDPPVTMPAAPPAQRAPVRQAPSPSSEVRQAPSPVRVPVAAPVTATRVPAAAGDVDRYGPVKRNETLWDIAKRLRPDSDISMQQMMIALLRANPEAFTANNINNLKAGATLQIPRRDEILSLDKRAASREASRQSAEWQQGHGSVQPAAAETATETATEPPPQDTTGTASTPTDTQETRLQLVAPDEEAIKGAAVPGMPEGSTATQAPGSQALLQQLALATEEAEAGRAQSEELQTRVGKLEEQVADMQRLIELKDAELANLQNRLAAQNQTAANTSGTATPEAGAPAIDQAESQSQETPAANAQSDAKPAGIIDRLLENPVLAGLGVLVAMILGGFLWSSTRHRKQEDIFRDEPTFASQMSAARNEEPPATRRIAVSDTSMPSDLAPNDIGPLQGDETSDPLTEADVFIAYGRVQQAEEVIKSALQSDPDNDDLKMKLIEIYHAAGNSDAFDARAAELRETVDEDDPDWQRVASMGYELSPANPLYQMAISQSPVRDGEVDFDMDLAGMEESTDGSETDNAAGDDIGLEYDTDAKSIDDTAVNIDFNLDELNPEEEEEDLAEGLLQESDEIGTKLDLARAYMDMGDPDGARGILEEVIEEGNNEQKTEAENLISQLA